MCFLFKVGRLPEAVSLSHGRGNLSGKSSWLFCVVWSDSLWFCLTVSQNINYVNIKLSELKEQEVIILDI